MIVGLIESGAADYIAAEAAGVEARTFREWIARGEGRHPTRSCTTQLEAFAREVRRAQATARVRIEALVAERSPQYWLTHMARSRAGRDGWTEPVPDPAEAAAPTFEPTLDEAREAIHVAIRSGAITLACEEPACPCALHGAPHAD